MNRLYTREEFVAAYLAWANTDPDDHRKRVERWDAYCDVRDNVPMGTSQKFRVYGDRFLAAAAMGTVDA